MGFIEEVIEGPRQFYINAERLIRRCTKPNQKEFLQVTQAVGVGLLVMGFIGFFVKLIHIPINNIIV